MKNYLWQVKVLAAALFTLGCPAAPAAGTRPSAAAQAVEALVDAGRGQGASDKVADRAPDKVPAKATLPGREEPCADGLCAAGLECVRYFGIAGPRGPEFTSCEKRCRKATDCAPEQACVIIADGPGQVCRPK